MKCLDCKYAELKYFTSYDRIGVFSSHVCTENITIGKIVDGELERECAKFKAIEKAEVTQNAQG